MAVVHRYFAHAVVLALAITLSGYASVDRQLPAGLSLRLGSVNAEGLVIGQGGGVGSVRLGRLSTIVKPVAIPTSSPVSHVPLTYTVAPGDSLASLSSRFKVPVESLRWSNYSSLSSAATDVRAGDVLLVPPVAGVVVVAREGDTPASLAAAYHVDASSIVDYNYLRTDASTALLPGTVVVIPGGVGPEIAPVPVVAPVRVARASSSGSYGSSASPGYTVSGGGGGAWTPQTGNRFAYGYCTWYVYNRRPVPWLGNAWEWYGQAVRYGWAVGSTPRAGAIMVTWESGWGHVAYVESVAPDGSWTVSEMNFKGWGVVDTRTIRPGGVPLIGFIY